LQDHVQTPAVPDSINAQKTLHVAAAAAKIDLNILLAGLKSGVDPFPQAGAMPPFQKAFIGPDGVNCNLLKAYQVLFLRRTVTFSCLFGGPFDVNCYL
jgi:hypothetical protein